MSAHRRVAGDPQRGVACADCALRRLAEEVIYLQSQILPRDRIAPPLKLSSSPALRRAVDVADGSMLSKKSKIEQLPKSRERPCLPAAASASLCLTRTKLCGSPSCDASLPLRRDARRIAAVKPDVLALFADDHPIPVMLDP
jgi:hypothetical protein